MTDSINRTSSTPLYMQIRDFLHRRIADGVYPPGQLLPSIREIANEFYVSVVTVRQAIELLVNDGTVAKRQGLGCYVRESISEVKPEHPPTIVFLRWEDVPEWPEYGRPIMKESEKVLDRAGFTVQYGPLNRESLERFMIHCTDHAKGFIIAGGYHSSKDLLKTTGLPVVAFAENPERVDRSFVKDVVNLGDYQGVRSTVDYVVSLGHKRIAYLAGPREEYSTTRRLRAFRDGIADHGIEVLDGYIQYGDFSIERGREATGAMLELPDRPTAILCANDYTAFGAMAAIQAAGLRIPEDISVTGFDDVEMSAHVTPALTTIAVSRVLLGGLLARLMVERLANPAKPFTSIELEPELVVRESCKNWDEDYDDCQPAKCHEEKEVMEIKHTESQG